MERILKCGTTLLFDEADLPIIEANNWQSNNGYIFYTKSIDGKLTVSIQVNKKRRRIGYFDDEISAALTYNEAALKELGDKAKLNVISIV